MTSLPELLQILVSFFVEIGGQGVTRGGKGMALSGLRKIGWAKQGGGSKSGKRLGGHRLGGRGTGGSYQKPRKGGRQNAPARLHGRPDFSGANTINGEQRGRWVKGQQGNRGGYTPRPRSYIKF